MNENGQTARPRATNTQRGNETMGDYEAMEAWQLANPLRTLRTETKRRLVTIAAGLGVSDRRLQLWEQGLGTIDRPTLDVLDRMFPGMRADWEAWESARPSGGSK